MDDSRRDTDRFDSVADDYDSLHAKSVAAAGEPIGYFAQYKIDRMTRLGVPADADVLDFGCGVGNLTTLLHESFGSVVGYDPSPHSIEVARERVPGVQFFDDASHLADSAFDVVVLAGVMHHVPVDVRADVAAEALSKVKSGGRLVVFEHNPFNPLTRRVVRMCAFDDDAILLTPRELTTTLKKVGATSVRQDFIVFFPHALAALRPLEPALRRVPIGAQTMTVATR